MKQRRSLGAVLLAVAGLAGCGEVSGPVGEDVSVIGAELDASVQTSQAGETACYVYVAGDCHGWVPQATWFYDDGNGASSNSSVCLHRARDYATWCGLQNPDDQVFAAFNWRGVTILVQQFRPGFDFHSVDPRAVTYGAGWTPITTSVTEALVIGAADPGTSRYPDIWRMSR